jgi:uncharacterized FlaG/YvyC family protein
MDTGLNIRPVQTAPIAPPRIETSAVRPVARTELPEAQTVQAVADVSNVTFDQNDQQRQMRAQLNASIDARSAAPQKKVDRDAATQELIFRTVSAETGRVVSQYPDEAALRQRAYNQQQLRAQLEAQRTGNAAEQDKVA